MSITTYGELKTAVANFTHDDQLTSRIPEFIALAEDRLYQKLRIRFMEQSSSLTVSSQTVALPTRFVQARRIYLTGTPIQVLNFMDVHNFWGTYTGSNTGKPKAFTIEGENMVFGPSPDETYTGALAYYQRPAALSADSDTNWLLTNARGLLLYGALIEAAPYLKDDPRILTWSTLYEELLKDVMDADSRDRHSGSPMRMRSLYGGMSGQ